MREGDRGLGMSVCTTPSQISNRMKTGLLYTSDLGTLTIEVNPPLIVKPKFVCRVVCDADAPGHSRLYCASTGTTTFTESPHSNVASLPFAYHPKCQEIRRVARITFQGGGSAPKAIGN